MTKKDELKNRVLNGGRGSGQSLRLLVEVYENQIVDLQHKVDTLQGFLDHDIEYDMDKAIQGLKKENAELKEINEGYNRNRDRLIAMGFPTFKSCKEYSGKLTNLQKENAGLKAQLQKKINTTTVSDYPYSALKLEEAKEIIKQLLLLPYANNEEVFADVTSILDKAEQFLKE